VQDSNLKAIPTRIMPGAALMEKAHPDTTRILLIRDGKSLSWIIENL
jgi:hypothetical protein